MLSITFPVGPQTDYRAPSLEMPNQIHQIEANFEEGDHVFTSSDFKLGTVHSIGGRDLIARVTFKYSYDATNRVITVCGTDYPSADGMTLITTPQGINEVCFEHAAAVGFPAEEIYHNRYWNTHSQLMPGAAAVFKDITRRANDALISALNAKTPLHVRVRDLLPELANQHYQDLCIVHRKGKVLGSYDPTFEYGQDDKVTPAESTYKGTYDFNKKDDFANVIGSTDDKYPKGFEAWLKLWEVKCNNSNKPTACTSLNTAAPDWDCGPPDKGGHIIPGQQAKKMDKGSEVYIFPICAHHNGNDNIYMEAIEYTEAVNLINYLETDSESED